MRIVERHEVIVATTEGEPTVIEVPPGCAFPPTLAERFDWFDVTSQNDVGRVYVRCLSKELNGR